MIWTLAAMSAVLVAAFLQTGRDAQPAAAPVWYDYHVVQVYPHDPEAFTQGLVFRDGDLFESTGRYGHSSLRRVRLETGAVIREHRLDDRFFGEGLADWGTQLIQITWQEQTAFVYDLETFAPQRTFTYRGQGWGLTHDGRRLILSDGTADLRFLDPETFAETGRLRVTDRGRAVQDLNELEMVRGELFANVWGSDHVLIIDPQSGRVTGRIDLSGLLSREERAGVDVLNGIAHDAGADRLFVTGKLWPKLFEIRLVRRP